MKKLLAVVFTVLTAASLSFAQTGAATGRVRGGKGASNNSSAREHKGGNNDRNGGKKSKKAGSNIPKGWNQKTNARK